MGQSAVSQHLKVLSEQNIVSSKRMGKKIIYKIADPKLKLYWFSCTHYFANSSGNILAKLDIFSKKPIL